MSRGKLALAALVGAAGLAAILEWVVPGAHHGVPGLQAVIGFAGAAGLIFGAALLGRWLRRPEGHYGD